MGCRVAVAAVIEPVTAAEPRALSVLWREGDWLAVHKPAGWLVHRTGLDAGETRFVVQTLRDQLGRHVHPVHRLDKGTSGVLLMALSPAAARELSLQFEQRQVHKRYLAMVRGWPPASCSVDHALRPDDAPPDAPPQSALTHLRRLATWELPVPVDRYPSTRVALVEACPETGRRHQIRRHLKHLAHPIIGDATHGKGAHNRGWAERLGLQRLWLHAAELRLRHPVDGRELSVRSDPRDAALNADWCHLLSQPWDWTPSAPAPAPQPAPGRAR
ncbi:MAG: pseudouridine synthase [Proteobacteria bacterium]|nr:pseudouridine synthase [Pseudomonadota bacterium]